jgi:polar amino acid transport system substrate-binding protein
MKKIITLLIISGSLFASQIIELNCDKGYPPYSYKENKVVKGVYVDVIKAIFSKIPEYDVKFKAMAWKHAISKVKQGKSIGFFPPYYLKKRTLWTKFSKPILGETSIVFAKQHIIDTKKNFPEDYKGLTVCMNRGFDILTQADENFEKMIKDKSIKLKLGDNNKNCLTQVQKNKADFYLNDQLIDIKDFPNIKRGVVTKNNYGYIGFTLKDKNFPYIKDLESKFNQTLIKIQKSGELNKILQKYK